MNKDKVSRGFVVGEQEEKLSELSRGDLLGMLKSSTASQRTRAIRYLFKNNYLGMNDVEMLCMLLSKEKALYVRIEIENVLTTLGSLNVSALLESIGKIGNNQHNKRGETSLKKSYPLPRDLIARIIGHLVHCDIDELYRFIPIMDRNQLSELIDGIGFLTFYNPEFAQDKLFSQLMNHVKLNYAEDELILWKFYTYCSSFTSVSIAYAFLKNEQALRQNDSEIMRSLSFFEKYS